MMAADSRFMRFFQRLGLEPIAWALRRLYCPVPKSALVLEVGSGGNPYARANVLLDAYESTRERHWVALKADRPTVLGFVEALPFRDKAFDFAIASHVLEHSVRPERFLSELQRVARAGYIEVPDAFMERVNPYMDHRLEITCRDHTLIIRKKPGWIVDTELVELYEHRVKPHMTGDLMHRHPFAFHVRYFWENRISFTILNPEVNAGWPAPGETRVVETAPSDGGPRQLALNVLRYVFSQRLRHKRLNLLTLLRCPACHAEVLNAVHDAIICVRCDSIYPVRNGIPIIKVQLSAESITDG